MSQKIPKVGRYVKPKVRKVCNTDNTYGGVEVIEQFPRGKQIMEKSHQALAAQPGFCYRV